MAGAARALTGLFVGALVAVPLLAAIPARSATRVIGDGQVSVRYAPRNERVARRVLAICHKHLPELSAQLQVKSHAPVRVKVVDDLRPYRHAFRGGLPVWGVAFTVLETGQVVVDVKRAIGAWNSLDRVLAHELSHVLIARRVGRIRMPIWFLEGLARWQSGEWGFVDSWQLMNAVSGGRAPRLWELEMVYPANAERARTAYRISYRAVQSLFHSRFDRLNAFLDEVIRQGSFRAAFPATIGETEAAWMESFHQDLERRYHSWLLVFQTGPLFGIISVLFLFAIIRYQIRKRRKLKELARSAEGLSLDVRSGPGV